MLSIYVKKYEIEPIIICYQLLVILLLDVLVIDQFKCIMSSQNEHIILVLAKLCYPSFNEKHVLKRHNHKKLSKNR